MGKDLKGKEIGKGISQRKDGKYQARYVDRFGVRQTIYATSKSEIKNKLAVAVKLDMEKGSVKKQMTVAEWYNKWMDIYKAPIVRANTKRHYEYYFNSLILPEIGNLNMDSVLPLHVKKLINDMNKKGYRWEAQNKVRILLTDLFNRAIENDYALKNPTRGVRLAKNKPKERIVLTREQQEDFLMCSAGTFYDNLFVVAVNTGLRSGELCALTMDDLDFENNIINVNKTLLYQKLDGDLGKTFHLGPPKTDSSIRKVYINDTCRVALKKQIQLKTILSHKYKKEDEFKDCLFVTKFNTPINSVIFNQAIDRIIKEINLQREESEMIPTFSAHTLRHTFATRCIESGITPKVVQKLLGHATIGMTMNLYVHATEEYIENELKKLDECMGRRSLRELA